MCVSKQLATHLRAVHFGGNWTSVNIKDVLADITIEEANTQIKGLNSILALSYHMSYYVTGVLEVFHNRPLKIKDKLSYDHPEISTETQWKMMCDMILTNAETLAQHIETLADTQIWEDFVDSKYGNYFSNINGIIEHTHYHLGQIVLLKKMIRSKKTHGTGEL
ncbi:hypothetical protein A9Q86_01685 [Flavobacteriales bacterium 33_180_T64]|nr:hypothetical protein A9Q86_01685 [Flavobacteriales bacterium 33_180_T64]